MRTPLPHALLAAALGAATLLALGAAGWAHRRAAAAEDRALAAEARLARATREAAEETRGRLGARAIAAARVPGEGLSALGAALRAMRLAERAGVAPPGGVRHALHQALTDVTRSLALDGHRAPLTALALSPDGRRVFTTDAAGQTRAWDAATGVAVEAPAPPAAAESVPAGPWSSLAPTAVRASADGRRAVVLARGEATLWDADGRAPRATLAGHLDPVTDVAVTGDGARALTTSYDGTARVWDVATGAALRTLAGHRAEVLQGRFTRDGRAAVTLGGDRVARVWALGGTPLTYELRHPAGAALRAVRFSPDGRRLVTASDPPLVWETDTGRLVATLPGGRADDAGFSADGSLVLLRGPDGVRVARADGAGEVARVPGQARDAALSDDGRRALVVGADGVARLHDAASGALVAALGGAAGELAGAMFVGATGLVLVARTVGDPGLWRASDGALERALEGHQGAVRALAATADGRYVAAAGEGGARLWNAASGLRFGVIDEHPGGVTAARFSRDGSHLVTVGADGSARVWAVQTVERVALLQNPEQPFVDAHLSDDGSRAAALTRWGVAQVWVRAQQNLGRPLGGHRRRVDVARLSPDARTLVTASADRTARLYMAATGEGLATLEGHAQAVVDARYSPDGRRVATVGADGAVRVWAVDAGEWVSLACTFLPAHRFWANDRPLQEYCAAHRGPTGLRPDGR